MQRWSDERRRAGETVAFVPTMGFLHEGHLSLVRRAREVGTHVVVSIFVNPMQFNQPTDYDAYPHDKEKDVRLLEDLETQVLFMPSAKDIYPVGFQSSVEVSFSRCTQFTNLSSKSISLARTVLKKSETE